MIKQLKTFLLISLGVLLTCNLFIFFIDKPLTIFLHSYNNSLAIKGFNFIREGLDILPLQVYFTFFIISVILFKKKYIFNFSFLLISDVICVISTRLTKSFFGRSRPFSLIENNEYDFYWRDHPTCGSLPNESYAYNFFDGWYCYDSFPSGHASGSFCIAFAIGLLYPSLRPILLFYACAVAISRVITTIHYFSDIVFGSYLAFVVVYSVHFVFKILFKRFGVFEGI